MSDTDRQKRAARPVVEPTPRLFEVKPWANANKLGENAVYRWCRRAVDPMPHVKHGTHILIDDELAIAWLRRNYGVGYEAA